MESLSFEEIKKAYNKELVKLETQVDPFEWQLLTTIPTYLNDNIANDRKIDLGSNSRAEQEIFFNKKIAFCQIFLEQYKNVPGIEKMEDEVAELVEKIQEYQQLIKYYPEEDIEELEMTLSGCYEEPIDGTESLYPDLQLIESFDAVLTQLSVLEMKMGVEEPTDIEICKEVSDRISNEVINKHYKKIRKNKPVVNQEKIAVLK